MLYTRHISGSQSRDQRVGMFLFMFVYMCVNGRSVFAALQAQQNESSDDGRSFVQEQSTKRKNWAVVVFFFGGVFHVKFTCGILSHRGSR